MVVIESRSPLAIAVAMPRERDAVLKSLSLVECRTTGGYRFFQCQSHGLPVVVVETGAGMDNAGQAAHVLIKEFHPAVIFSFGFAGAVDARVERGTVILGRKTCFAEPVGRCYPSDPQMLDLVAQALDVAKICSQQGRILTVAQPLCTAEDKGRAAGQHGCIAVDMESAVLAESAQAAKVPFLSVRTILDQAHEDLVLSPGSLQKNGRIAVLKVLGVFLRYPKLIPAACRLILAFNIAGRNVQGVTDTIMSAFAREYRKPESI